MAIDGEIVVTPYGHIRYEVQGKVLLRALMELEEGTEKPPFPCFQHLQLVGLGS